LHRNTAASNMLLILRLGHAKKQSLKLSVLVSNLLRAIFLKIRLLLINLFKNVNIVLVYKALNIV
jgi:hypothetical protein